MDVADPEQVPHFADMGATGPKALASARRWLNGRGFTITGFSMAGSEPVADVMQWMGENNPDTTWLLLGSTAHPHMRGSGGDHVVVCQGGAMVHDPGWVPSSIKSPGSSGHWEIWVVSRL